jgi:hypothetical protein
VGEPDGLDAQGNDMLFQTRKFAESGAVPAAGEIDADDCGTSSRACRSSMSMACRMPTGLPSRSAVRVGSRPPTP